MDSFLNGAAGASIALIGVVCTAWFGIRHEWRRQIQARADLREDNQSREPAEFAYATVAASAALANENLAIPLLKTGSRVRLLEHASKFAAHARRLDPDFAAWKIDEAAEACRKADRYRMFRPLPGSKRLRKAAMRHCGNLVGQLPEWVAARQDSTEPRARATTDS